MAAKTARALRSLEKSVAELRAALEAEDSQVADERRWRRMLTMVEEAGGTVTGVQWRELGVKCGYDARGLGGFYRGTNASMKRNANNTRSLTASGKNYLNKYGRAH
jgi:hypothetical protein